MPKNAHGPLTVEIYRSRAADPKQRYRWRATAKNGKKVANSGEGYTRIFDADDMATYLIGPPDEGSLIEGKGNGANPVVKRWTVTK